MKKIVSLLLVLCLLTAAGSVFAEESYDIEVKLPESAPVRPELKDLSSFATASADKVSVTGNYHVIQFHGLTLLLDVPSSYMSVTQDYFASLNYYSQMKDPDEILNYLIDNEIHLVIFDVYTGTQLEFCYLGADNTSARIGSLASLDEAQCSSFGSFFATAVGLDAPAEYISANGVTWGRSQNIYFTVVGGQYVYIRLTNNNGDLSEDDYADAKDVISLVSIYG